MAGQVTAETLRLLQGADKLLCLVDHFTEVWLQSINPSTETLKTSYQTGRPRIASYDEMVERMLEPARRGLRVCAIFYGHPGVFATPTHEAIRRAALEGIKAEMLPAISAEDCLFADLCFDPGTCGWQTFDATDFLVRRRQFDPHSSLILWQIGAIGVATYYRKPLWNRKGLAVLVETLQRTYSPEHKVTLYQISRSPLQDPVIRQLQLREVARARVTTSSTLYVP